MIRPATEKMTSRQRILAAIAGEEVDRFPVWLKMTNDTWRTSQPEAVRKLGNAELLAAAGCDLMVNNGIGADRTAPHVTTRVEAEPDRRLTIVETPDGVLTSEMRRDAQTNSWHPTKYLLGSVDELRASRWLYTDTAYAVPADRVETSRQRQEQIEADHGVSMTGVGPGPLMNLIENNLGPENTTYMMFDEPELFREVIELMHQDRLRQLRALLPAVQADTFWMTENTSTSLISPEMFREFCMPHLAAYGKVVLDNDVIPVHHMCGTLNALLEMIDELPAMANEAYTTRPLGDVSLAEGRRRMPSKCLIGGTNATLWMRPAGEIIAAVADDLAACPDRRKIFLTSAGVLPPVADLEKSRAVVEGLKRL